MEYLLQKTPGSEQSQGKGEAIRATTGKAMAAGVPKDFRAHISPWLLLVLAMEL